MIKINPKNGCIEIENADVARGKFRNFAGECGPFNPNGKRSFNLFFEEDEGQYLEENGWNIHWLEPRDDQENRRAKLSVEVRFDVYPPKIELISGPNRTRLDENNISILDTAEIENCDAVIRPRYWEDNTGATKIKAYLKSMYVTLQEDDFGGKYAD